MPILPRLHPLPLSYMVSPSVPNLEISISELTGESPTVVSFFATHIDGAASRARIVFETGLWVRFAPAYSDRETVRENAYDWSAVPLLSIGADFGESLRRRQEKWQETGLCPDPNAYEVAGSPWLAEHDHPVDDTLKGSKPFRHYLILGHDCYVEVLASDWHQEELSERRYLTAEAPSSGDAAPPSR